MKSFFDTARKSEINPPGAERFLNPIFHYSTIPSFHWTVQGKLHPSGVDQSRALPPGCRPYSPIRRARVYEPEAGPEAGPGSLQMF